MKAVNQVVKVPNSAGKEFEYQIIGYIMDDATFVGEVVSSEGTLTVEPVNDKWEYTDINGVLFTHDSFRDLVAQHSWFRLLWRSIFNG